MSNTTVKETQLGELGLMGLAPAGEHVRMTVEDAIKMIIAKREIITLLGAQMANAWSACGHASEILKSEDGPRIAHLFQDVRTQARKACGAEVCLIEEESRSLNGSSDQNRQVSRPPQRVWLT